MNYTPIKIYKDLEVFSGYTNVQLRRIRKAAPDMYEALKDIIEQAEETLLPLGADLADSIRIFGKQALAKAKGE